MSEAGLLRKSHSVVVGQQVRVRRHDISDLGNGRCVSLHDERGFGANYGNGMNPALVGAAH